MLGKPFLLLLALLCLFRAGAQQTIYTQIQKNKKTYPAVNYYIDKVIDARQDKESIGFIYKTNRVGERPLNFKKQVPDEFLDFLQKTFPNRLSNNKIAIKINSFKIGHLQTGKKNDTCYVEINADYFKLQNDSAFHLYNYTYRLAEASADVEPQLPNLIKRALFLSMTRLESSLNNTTGVQAKSLSMTEVQAVNTGTGIGTSGSPPANPQQLEKEDTTLNNYYLLIGSSNSLSFNDYMLDGTISLMFRMPKFKTMMVGTQGSLFVFGLYPKNLLPVNTGYAILKYDLGIRLLKQIKNNHFFNFSSVITLGYEKYKRYTQVNILYQAPQIHSETVTRALTGFEIDLGICNFHPKNAGLYYGGDFFIRDTSSDIFQTSAGIKFNLGLKF